MDRKGWDIWIPELSGRGADLSEEVRQSVEDAWVIACRSPIRAGKVSGQLHPVTSPANKIVRQCKNRKVDLCVRVVLSKAETQGSEGEKVRDSHGFQDVAGCLL